MIRAAVSAFRYIVADYQERVRMERAAKMLCTHDGEGPIECWTCSCNYSGF